MVSNTELPQVCPNLPNLRLKKAFADINKDRKIITIRNKINLRKALSLRFIRVFPITTTQIKHLLVIVLYWRGYNLHAVFGFMLAPGAENAFNGTAIAVIGTVSSFYVVYIG